MIDGDRMSNMYKIIAVRQLTNKWQMAASNEQQRHLYVRARKLRGGSYLPVYYTYELCMIWE